MSYDITALPPPWKTAPPVFADFAPWGIGRIGDYPFGLAHFSLSFATKLLKISI